MKTHHPIRILVTGADGQLGTALQRQYHPDGALIMSFASHARLDISQAAAIGRWLDAHPTDIVINAAAYTAVDQAETDHECAMQINGTAAGTLAAECAQRGVRLVHLSTDYVFDGEKQGLYAECDTPRPINAYGRSKLAGEEQIRRIAPEAIILRTGWVFSPWGRNFLKTMLALGDKTDAISVVSDEFGCPSYAPHVAQALLRLTRHPKQDTPGGIYHFAGTPPISRQHFAKAIFSEAVRLGVLARTPTVHPISSEHWPAAAHRPRNSSLEASKLETLLGPMACDWRDGLREALTILSDARGYNSKATLRLTRTPPWHA